MIGKMIEGYPLQYPKFPNLSSLCDRLREFARLKFEFGSDADEIESFLNKAYAEMKEVLESLLSLQEDPELARKEPNSLEDIRKIRPEAERRLWKQFNAQEYVKRLAGAFVGRMAGCTLGAPVELWSTDAMQEWARNIGDSFPPTNYLSRIKNPNEKRYEISTFYDYTRPGLHCVPADDDIAYTLLGLLLAEEYGLDFSVEDVGKSWVKYLPFACTAEEIALNHLKAGVNARIAAERDNPYMQWIGADIRSDPWGYMAPGLPEKAAEMAWNDAMISHRRNGIYGEMYFSAVIASAFTVNDPVDALVLGLNEIPANCLLANDVRWAIEKGKSIGNYSDARIAVRERFGDMSELHTNINACLTIFGLMIGGNDFTRCIGETVAMGYDNDCTAATAGSIFGASKGIYAVPEYWYKPFEDSIMTYLFGLSAFTIGDVLNRFTVLAEKAFKQQRND